MLFEIKIYLTEFMYLHVYLKSRVLEILRQLPYFKDPENTTTDPVAAYKLMRQLRILWLTIIKTTENNPYDGILHATLHQNIFLDIDKGPFRV